MMTNTTKYILTATAALTLVATAIVIVILTNKSKKSTSMKKISAKGLDLIKEFEGKRLTAYQCSAGVWTIGYGHTSGVKQGDTCTEQEATEFLKQDCVTAENSVNAQNLNLNQNQFDALVSFVFNVGSGNFAKSTLLKKAKANPDDKSIADEFLRWNKVGTTVVNGLTRRRQAESNLYFA